MGRRRRAARRPVRAGLHGHRCCQSGCSVEPDYLIEENTRWFERIDDVLEQEREYPRQQFYLVPWSWRGSPSFAVPLTHESGAFQALRRVSSHLSARGRGRHAQWRRQAAGREADVWAGSPMVLSSGVSVGRPAGHARHRSLERPPDDASRSLHLTSRWSSSCRRRTSSMRRRSSNGPSLLRRRVCSAAGDADRR